MSKSNTKLISETEPRSIGKISAGRQMVEGKINLMGQVIQKTDEVWNLKTNEKDFCNKLHSFDWVDDLAALGSAEAVSYTHLRAHETREDRVCRLLD